ncbi:MAG: hypothetical protein GXO02_06025 [Epsilonproteobacteria bacterium]|nr:hypothetical protein [Campylobacterota bacterium]
MSKFILISLLGLGILSCAADNTPKIKTKDGVALIDPAVAVYCKDGVKVSNDGTIPSCSNESKKREK